MENSQNSFSVPRWLLEMGYFRAGVYTWMGMGFFPLPQAKNKNIKSFPILIANPTFIFSL
jgi:hypothetical protein